MTIITRYIVREFIKVFFYSLAVIIILFFIGDLSERLGDFLQHQASFFDVLRYFLFKISSIIFLTIPIPVLLATTIVLGILNRNFEIIALRSSGVSLGRTISPILITALVISIITLVGNELITPYATQKAKAISNEIKGRERETIFSQNQIWFRSKEIIYNIKYFSPKTNTLHGITLYFFDPDFILYKRIDAEWADWEKDHWVFHNVFTRTFDSNQKTIKTLFENQNSLPLEETPETFKQEVREPEEMSYFELKRYIEKTTEEGYDTTKFLTDLYAKISSPFINFIIALCGIPFALRIGRHGGFALGVTLSFIICFIYWVFFTICLSLGKGGALPPLISAWAGNFVFGILGLYLLLHTRY